MMGVITSKTMKQILNMLRLIFFLEENMKASLNLRKGEIKLLKLDLCAVCRLRGKEMRGKINLWFTRFTQFTREKDPSLGPLYNDTAVCYGNYLISLCAKIVI